MLKIVISYSKVSFLFCLNWGRKRKINGHVFLPKQHLFDTNCVTKIKSKLKGVSCPLDIIHYFFLEGIKVKSEIMPN